MTELKVQSSKLKVVGGVSLLEMLVVISVFAILAIVTVQAVILTLRAARKSDAQGRVRENLDYSLAVMERQLRNAETATCTSLLAVSYTDKNGLLSSFSCVNVGPGGYVASGSARLTSDTIKITSCQFSCQAASGNVPTSVNVAITAEDVAASGVEAVQVSSSIIIFLRNY